MKVAVIDKQPNNNDYSKYFSFPCDTYHLSNTRVKRLLKKDVTLEVDTDKYDFVILVGSDAVKHFTKLTSVLTYSGHLVDDKFIPIIDPSMLVFKPEATKLWEDSLVKVQAYVRGEILVTDKGDYIGIEEEHNALLALEIVLNAKEQIVALDCETSSLYPREGIILGISISYKEHQGYYISSDVLTDECLAILRDIISNKTIVMHNKKFDIAWMEYHLGLTFGIVQDTMLMHYTLDEKPGTHGLKQLCIKYTDLGDYDRDLDTFKKEYCRAHSIKQEDFSYDLIPFDIMYPYAAKDTAGTLALYNKFLPLVEKSDNLSKVYNKILTPSAEFIRKLENVGVPFDMERVNEAKTYLHDKLDILREKLYTYTEVADFEAVQMKTFNPNSPIQLRKLMFDHLGLTPTGKLTGTGAASTDVEVLTILSKEHEIPALILEIRQTGKMLNTYITKIIKGVDRDGRLRTNFNLSFTTSGRLSSSGKLNMQQIPRDNPIIKGCIRARPGYKIVAMDLGSAETYFSAALSKDKGLMQIFIDGGDPHSSVAKNVFNLNCELEDVKNLFPTFRQAAKTVAFSTLYGSGAANVAHAVNEFALKYSIENNTEYVPFTISDAKDSIKQYFDTYPKLKKWITKNQKFIRDYGYIYSHFGRKRRLPNVFSKDNGVASGEVRSGLNFLIQSVASDVNLLGAMEAFNLIEQDRAKMFALVHDSVIAEVREDYIEEYSIILANCIQKDRGLSIPGSPIGLDFDISQDYSLGKFEKVYPGLC